METRHLEYFVAVAQEGSFTRAAERLGAGQSAVSAGIRALERDLGAAVFVRSTRSVRLSPAGEALLPLARETMESLDRVHDAIAGSQHAVRGRLRLGVFANVDMIDAPVIASRFRKLYPDVTLTIAASPAGSTGMVEDIREGRLDVAVVGLPASYLSGLRLTELGADRMVAVVPAAHRLARGGSVSLPDLVSEPFIDGPQGFGNRVVLEGELASQRLRRTIVVESPDMGVVPRFVAAGFGVAVLPSRVVRPAEGAVVVPVVPAISFPIYVATRQRTTRSVDAAVEVLREHLDQVARAQDSLPSRTSAAS